MAASQKVLKKKAKPKRPGKLRQWTDEAMLGALQAVREGTLGVNRAALEFAVPATTLKDRLSGRVTHGTHSGAQPYLSKAEEEELVDFLIKCSKLGYGKTRKEVLVLVESILKKKGKALESLFLMDGGYVSRRGGLI